MVAWSALGIEPKAHKSIGVCAAHTAQRTSRKQRLQLTQHQHQQHWEVGRNRQPTWFRLADDTTNMLLQQSGPTVQRQNASINVLPPSVAWPHALSVCPSARCVYVYQSLAFGGVCADCCDSCLRSIVCHLLLLPLLTIIVFGLNFVLFVFGFVVAVVLLENC